eukprot:Clim_evm5s162 gene=Clim_evmTU5s162
MAENRGLFDEAEEELLGNVQQPSPRSRSSDPLRNTGGSGGGNSRASPRTPGAAAISRTDDEYAYSTQSVRSATTSHQRQIVGLHGEDRVTSPLEGDEMPMESPTRHGSLGARLGSLLGGSARQKYQKLRGSDSGVTALDDFGNMAENGAGGEIDEVSLQQLGKAQGARRASQLETVEQLGRYQSNRARLNSFDEEQNHPRISRTLQRFLSEEEMDTELTRNWTTQYSDFNTIDWLRDTARERHRKRRIRKSIDRTYTSLPKIMWDSGQAWFIVTVVGILSGMFAASISVGVEWLVDMRIGVCPSQFWLNKNFCCWTDTAQDGECAEWRTWAQLMGVTNSFGSFIINYTLYVLASLLFAWTAAMMVQEYAPFAAGSGIPEVKTILSGFVMRDFLSLRTLLVKAMGLVVSVASGLSLGKEGPLVHVASCCGNLIANMFPKYRYNEAKKREMLSAASAAGVSVAFGAPIGGVLFSLEEVSYYFPHKTLWRSFFCAMAAAFTLQYANPNRSGRLVLFYVTYDHPWHLFEIIPFIFVGVMGGLYGAFFIKYNIKWCEFRRTSFLSQHPIKDVVTVAAIGAAVNYINPFMRGNTAELIGELFSECLPNEPSHLCSGNVTSAVLWLLLAIGFKAVITIFTFGLKVPAGLFIPTMAVGAIFGRLFGMTLEAIVLAQPSWFARACPDSASCITPGLYAMVGAAAALGGVTRMTVSLVVIMFELTGGLTYVVPVMIAVMVSKWIGDATGYDGIYDCHIELNGYPFLDNKADFSTTSLACDIMKPQEATDTPLTFLTLTGMTYGQLKTLLVNTRLTGFPLVVNEQNMEIAGYVSANELRSLLRHVLKSRNVVINGNNSSAASVLVGNNDTNDDEESGLRSPLNADDNIECRFTPALHGGREEYLDLHHSVDPRPMILTSQASMETVVEMFRKLGLRYVLIEENGRLAGIITKKDLLRFIHTDAQVIKETNELTRPFVSQ